MKRILLIKTDRRIPNWGVSPPLGLLYLASALRKRSSEKVELEVFDMRIYPRAISQLSEKIQDYQPEIVGISTISFEASVMHQVAALVKEYLPNCKVVAGGPHATVFYSQILEDKNIDYAVIGEGEISFVELVDRIFGQGTILPLPGVAGRVEEKVLFGGERPPIADLDTLPFPAWDLINLDTYLRFPDGNRSMGKGRYMGIFSSRACPYGCIYCHSIFGKKLRVRSPENVIAEMQTLKDSYSVQEFQVFDDCFNSDLNRAKRIGFLVGSQLPGVRISFCGGIRGDIVDKEFLEIFRRAGAYAINIAIETASPRLQKLIRKNLNLDKVRDAIIMADRLKYFVGGLFMIGFPTETEAEIRSTINYAMSLPLTVAGFFIVVPFPGTELFKMVRKEYSFSTVDLENLYFHSRDSSYQSLVNMNLPRIQKRAYIRFYLNPVRILKSVSRAPNPVKLLRQFIRYSFQALFSK